MASNPPFHVMEDQTDEDFFDKLVDDDFGPTNNPDSAPKFTDGSDSDEAKAFANLSIEDASGGGGGGGGGVEDKGGENDLVHGSLGLSGGLHVEESNNTLDSLNSLGSNTELNDDGINFGSEVLSDPVASKTIESTKSGVKEVGWSSFYADSLPNGNHGFGSYSDFFNELGGSSEDFPGKVAESANLENEDGGSRLHNSDSYQGYHEDTQSYGESNKENVNGQDLNNSQYWESMYPGWKYDANTGQWYQVDSSDTTTASAQGSLIANTAGNEWVAVSDGKTELNYLQQTSQSVVATVAETSTSENVSTWNQGSQLTNNGYPENMVFDPQYPGWYFDTITQDWHSLESYTSSVQSTTVENHDQQNSDSYLQNNNSSYGGYEQADKHGSQGYTIQGQHGNWSESYGNYNQRGLNMWQPSTDATMDNVSNFDGNQQLQNAYESNVSMNNLPDQQKSFNSLGRVPSYENVRQAHVEANGFVGSQSFISSGNFGQQYNQGHMKQSEQMSIPNDYYGSQKSVNVAQQSFQSSQQFSYAPNTGRSSAGRPPHALVTFGFGGKLIVMKDNSSSSLVNSSFGSQETVGGSISVMNLMEVVSGNNTPSVGGSSCSYFRALSQQSFPGPLVGGNVGNKELNKWIDERIASCELSDRDFRKGEMLKLLLSLLKIACQHYGKLRSPFGTDASLKESDSPESAVAKLFASVKRNGTQFSDYGALSHCLQSLPSEGQIRATASEVQNLLVSGRKKEALQCAQEGQLWGPALVLASQLGDQFYVDTVKQMALRQLVAGSPLRTLCLLIAGQPADVFSADTRADSSIPGAVIQRPNQFGANGMLDDWEENLAVITANRTKDDELVIIHLGDCLWKDRSEITAAHICYLVAEANFESYSDSARLCLIGADHWKQPRTYASPEAIQRTELYEYSKVLGNSQFMLLPFQPYKLIYAYMLAEVGKVSDSLKYCQAILKSLKTGRAPEVETWKQLVLSLEERIRTHQQGGYTTNLAPAKLVGKLLNFFDSTAHRVVGLPPPAPSTSPGGIQGNEHHHQLMGHRVSASQSTMAMSSLMPSASMEPISEWAADGNRMTMHNRSVSEPDFGRTPRQVESPKEGTSSSAQGKTAGAGAASRFGRFGFGSQLLQKTMGLVLRPRSDKQAKLGEKNKFYYDEKLKRWVEEGAEPPAEEAALPPPPTTSSLQNGMSDYNLKSALKSDGSLPNGSPTFRTPTSMEHSSGIPPIPTTSNQFSARGRMGVRARYVDTFNQGGGSSANLFHSPSVPSIKPAVSANAKFFVPAPPPSENLTETVQESTGHAENSSTPADNSFQSPPSFSKMNMQRFPSMDNITRKERMINGNAPAPSHSRRTASWSGSFNDSFSPPPMMETKTLGEALGRPPSSFMPVDPSMTHMPINGGGIGDDLHEVEL
ncbi:protein transport protein SEC16B homolog [Ricinus communis]|uniref:protein transport protein SEC16B homolog n=1 Tax=Ricinus communis TaxID=3988 RepID=UPI00201B266F|nr:protein transport protein SEC16B homolog [Ricinus communis]